MKNPKMGMEYLCQRQWAQQHVVHPLMIHNDVTYNMALQLGISMGPMDTQLILRRSKARQLVIMVKGSVVQ